MNKYRLSIIFTVLLIPCLYPQTVGIADPTKVPATVHKHLLPADLDKRCNLLDNNIKTIEVQQKIIRLQNQLYNVQNKKLLIQ